MNPLNCSCAPGVGSRRRKCAGHTGVPVASDDAIQWNRSCGLSGVSSSSATAERENGISDEIGRITRKLTPYPDNYGPWCNRGHLNRNHGRIPDHASPRQRLSKSMVSIAKVRNLLFGIERYEYRVEGARSEIASLERPAVLVGDSFSIQARYEYGDSNHGNGHRRLAR